MFPDEEYEPGGRGAIAEKHFAAVNVRYLIIDGPPGFSQLFAGWLPVLDYAFGKCIRAFLDGATSADCRLPALADDDFRSIVNIKQVKDIEEKRITSVERLVGKKFDVYALNAESRRYDYISGAERINLQPFEDRRENVTFRDGRLCAGAVCSTVVAWSNHEILEFETESGELKAWWIEER
jgi:hypothetical protein